MIFNNKILYKKMATTNKGFITDWSGNKLLPITRGELVLDSAGNVALNSGEFLAGVNGAQYGLVTAAERAMLTGDLSGGSGSIADLYNKVNYINSGLQFNGTTLKFFADDGTSTPINIISQGEGTLSIAINNNIVNLGLVPVNTSLTTISQIVDSINVDKFGRVTSVTGRNLNNSDIPYEISSKIIKDTQLSGCTTSNEDIGTDSKAIANKHYVDSAFERVAGIASGALRFGGPLSDAEQAKLCLSSTHQHKYFKVTNEFYLDVSNFYNSPEVGQSGTFQVKRGDTLIVYPTNSTYKFVYVPSGDDITTITVGKSGESSVLDKAIGHVNLQFDGCFDVINPYPGSSTTAKISIPEASSSQDGYLSKEDYNRFSSYQTTISYTGEFSSGNGVYKIGTLNINGTDNFIYGINNISSLSVQDGESSVYNPILRFTETNQDNVDITLRGYNGISVKRNNKAIEFAADNTVLEQDVPQIYNPRKIKYLKITDGYKFEVQLGSFNDDNSINDGLTDFSQFAALVNRVNTNTTFEVIKYSLSAADNDSQYRYGNQLLIDAITVTI